MFEKLKDFLKSEERDGEIVLHAPIEGDSVSISEVNDLTFSEEIVGRGMAIKPKRGRVVSPVDGLVSLMSETRHAVAIESVEGVEVLIHVGLDTVKLKGRHFTAHVHGGDRVRSGDTLLEFDINGILSEGYDIISPVVVTNPEDFESMEITSGVSIAEGDEIIKLCK
jgi:PTS system beta-glucosides-specific IIC component